MTLFVGYGLGEKIENDIGLFVVECFALLLHSMLYYYKLKFSLYSSSLQNKADLVAKCSIILLSSSGTAYFFKFVLNGFRQYSP